MELTKNIFFNTDKLIENSIVKISYTGKFFQDDHSEDVFIHYGFGINWDTFNFCLKNNLDEWDNNDGQNYIFPIEKAQKELIVLEDEPVSLGSARKLRRSYLWSKKVRLAVYKLITYLPKLISGNYKKKATNNGNS